MLFSVLMPVYNVEKYIAESIESIINQKFDDWELIIVDDGTKDNSGRIADSYAEKDHRVKVIHKQNGGLISARREAIKHASGQYCLFCDSDDFVKDTWMSEIKDIIYEYNFPNIVLFSAFKYSTKTGEVTPFNFPWDQKGQIPIDDARKCLISSYDINELWKKAIKRELLADDPLDYSVNYSHGYAEDLLQSLYPFDACESISVLPNELYYYRLNDDGMMYSKIKIDKVIDYTHVDVQRIAYPYVAKWEKSIDGLRTDFFKQCYRKVSAVYKNMIIDADSRAEIKEINDFDWKQCLPMELLSGFDYRKHFSSKDRILIRMALHPTNIGAFLLRLAYRILK